MGYCQNVCLHSLMKKIPATQLQLPNESLIASGRYPASQKKRHHTITGMFVVPPNAQLSPSPAHRTRSQAQALKTHVRLYCAASSSITSMTFADLVLRVYQLSLASMDGNIDHDSIGSGHKQSNVSRLESIEFLSYSNNDFFEPTIDQINATFSKGPKVWSSCFNKANQTSMIDAYAMMVNVPALPDHLPLRYIDGQTQWRIPCPEVTGEEQPDISWDPRYFIPSSSRCSSHSWLGSCRSRRNQQLL